MEKKNCKAGIILGIVGIITGIIIPIVGLGCGIGGVVVCSKNKEQMNVKAGMLLSVIAIVVSCIIWGINTYLIMQQMPAV